VPSLLTRRRPGPRAVGDWADACPHRVLATRAATGGTHV